jgi:uncharacterized membrane protein
MNDKTLEVLVGKLLRAGVLTSALVVAAGGALYLVQHHGDAVNYEVFHSESADLRSVRGITNLALHLDSEGIIQLGLLLLIATPVARVALAAWGFYLEQDHFYAAVSLLVLAILIFSLMHAR